MAKIATLTLNPAIDGASTAQVVGHTSKVRTRDQRFDPGGGGINVARVLTRLGADVEALYLAGGVTGPMLDGLLGRAGIAHRSIPVAGDTRISFAVLEEQTGHEYRFVAQGPQITAEECASCLAEIEAMTCDWLVLSGSLPLGMADDFYAILAARAQARGIAVVLDTSGAALKAGLGAGGLRLVKPSLGELEELTGRALTDQDAIIAAARALVDEGAARSIAVTLGARGAVLVEAERTVFLPAIRVAAISAVGAGDSFVAAMTYGLAAGWDSERAFRYGLAAGAAAAMTPGTDLAHAEDIERLAGDITAT
ncbi:MAG: 1-phosphofructokinase family hexose kinase [Erythrobacter sp.]